MAIKRLLHSGQRLTSIASSSSKYVQRLADRHGCGRAAAATVWRHPRAVVGVKIINPPGNHWPTIFVTPAAHVSRDTIGVKFREHMSKTLQTLVRKLNEHSRLMAEDLATINALGYTIRELKPNEDLIRQGEDPDVSALVISGMVARYHLLPNGVRQYLSFHMAGDMPDAQALFIDRMDHAVCAIGRARIASIRHKELLAAFVRRPLLGFAVWRETLIDAAIFREAITNNSARTMPARMAHLFCELFYRARASGLAEGNTLAAPINLVQLGETTGMSLASVNRALLELRVSRTMDFQRGRLQVKDWERLVELAGFNPGYLHQKKPPL